MKYINYSTNIFKDPLKKERLFTIVVSGNAIFFLRNIIQSTGTGRVY